MQLNTDQAQERARNRLDLIQRDTDLHTAIGRVIDDSRQTVTEAQAAVVQAIDALQGLKSSLDAVLQTDMANPGLVSNAVAANLPQSTQFVPAAPVPPATDQSSDQTTFRPAAPGEVTTDQRPASLDSEPGTGRIAGEEPHTET